MCFIQTLSCQDASPTISAFGVGFKILLTAFGTSVNTSSKPIFQQTAKGNVGMGGSENQYSKSIFRDY